MRDFSGGMRRRLDLAASLVATPPVLFFDEPTTGLDPESRNELWALLRELVAEGATLLLTTQYLEEADRLCDEIVLLDHGLIRATGTPAALKASHGGERIEVVLADPSQLEPGAAALAPFAEGACRIDPENVTVTAPVALDARLIEVVRALDDADIDAKDVHRREATLDDVFLSITTHATYRRPPHERQLPQVPDRRHPRADARLRGDRTGDLDGDRPWRGDPRGFRSLPMHRSAFLLGHLIAEFGAMLLAIVVMVISGLIVGWRIDSDVPHALAGFAMLALLAVTMLWVGTLLGVIARSPDVVTGIAFLIVFPLTFVASTFVPVAGLPSGLRQFAEYNPISCLAASLRSLFGNPTATPAHAAWPLQHPVISSLLWCAMDYARPSRFAGRQPAPSEETCSDIQMDRRLGSASAIGGA